MLHFVRTFVCAYVREYVLKTNCVSELHNEWCERNKNLGFIRSFAKPREPQNNYDCVEGSFNRAPRECPNQAHRCAVVDAGGACVAVQRLQRSHRLQAGCVWACGAPEDDGAGEHHR